MGIIILGYINTQPKNCNYNSYIAIIITLGYSIIYLFSNLYSNSLIINSLISLLILGLTIYILLQQNKPHTENILCIMIILALIFLINSTNLFSLFLAIELQAFCIYTLISISNNSLFSAEGALKYFLIGTIASALYILGVSLIYGNTGHLDLLIISDLKNNNLLFIIGSTLIIISILFKVGAAPFHLWLPDAYQSASYEVLLFISIAPKIFLFLLLNTLTKSFSITPNYLVLTIILSAIIGSIQAVQQLKIKRFLAYTIIYNNAFFLAIILISGWMSFYILMIAIILYLIGSILNLLPFWALKTPYGNAFQSLRDFISLRTSNPWYSFILIIGLFSSIGVPPLIGFFSKYFTFIALIEQNFIIVSLFLIVVTILPAYYYLRLTTILFFLPKSTRTFLIQTPHSLANTLSLLTILTLVFIIYAPGVLTLFSIT